MWALHCAGKLENDDDDDDDDESNVPTAEGSKPSDDPAPQTLPPIGVYPGKFLLHLYGPLSSLKLDVLATKGVDTKNKGCAASRQNDAAEKKAERNRSAARGSPRGKTIDQRLTASALALKVVQIKEDGKQTGIIALNAKSQGFKMALEFAQIACPQYDAKHPAWIAVEVAQQKYTEANDALDKKLSKEAAEDSTMANAQTVVDFVIGSEKRKTPSPTIGDDAPAPAKRRCSLSTLGSTSASGELVGVITTSAPTDISDVSKACAFCEKSDGGYECWWCNETNVCWDCVPAEYKKEQDKSNTGAYICPGCNAKYSGKNI